jgi:hypothetical protein
MNEKKALLVNIAVSAFSSIGSGICALQFAMAVSERNLGQCVLWFILASLCIETSVFSIANLIRKKK